MLHLPPFKLDHRPLLVRLEVERNHHSQTRPFRLHGLLMMISRGLCIPIGTLFCLGLICYVCLRRMDRINKWMGERDKSTQAYMLYSVWREYEVVMLQEEILWF